MGVADREMDVLRELEEDPPVDLDVAMVKVRDAIDECLKMTYSTFARWEDPEQGTGDQMEHMLQMEEAMQRTDGANEQMEDVQ